MAWGSVGDVLGNLAGVGLQGGFSALSASEAQDFVKEVAKKGPTWQRQGMVKAGYNPILPFINKGTAGPVATSVPQRAPISAPDLGSSARRGSRFKMELDLLSNQVKVQKNLVARSFNEVMTSGAVSHKADSEALIARMDRLLKEWSLPSARSQFRFDRSKAGGLTRQWNRFMRSALGRDSTSAK